MIIHNVKIRLAYCQEQFNNKSKKNYVSENYEKIRKKKYADRIFRMFTFKQ